MIVLPAPTPTVAPRRAIQGTTTYMHRRTKNKILTHSNNSSTTLHGHSTGCWTQLYNNKKFKFTFKPSTM